VNAANNTLLYEYSYDAWGRMRDKTSWTNYSPGSEPSLFIAGRGFTGHEHLPWFNLINMNGRIYDPLVGQFLSPDNYVQDPTFTQNYNRYTYCLNNPLKYVDPSGYVKLKTWDEFQDVVNNLMETGGSWNSETGYSYGNQGGGGDYGVPSGSGFQGPGQPYMLGEVTVTANETEKKTPTTPIVDNEDPFLGIINNGQGGSDYINTANNVNTGIGVGTGVLGGNYGLTANQTFRYAQRINGRVISAVELTAAHTAQSLKVANALVRLNVVTGVLGTGYSTAKAFSDYNKGGWDNVNGLDVADAGVGAGSLVVSGLVTLGWVSNPIGWGIGIGTGIYFGARFVYDLSVDKK
jgi:RHS repeat-associated protein